MKQHSQSIIKSSQVPQPVEKAVSLSGSFFNIVVSLDRETHKLVFGQWIFLWGKLCPSTYHKRFVYFQTSEV